MRVRSPWGIGSDHAQALAHEVVGDLVHLLLGADVQPRLLRVSLNRLIQRIIQPGLVVRVEIGVAQNGLGWLSPLYRARRRAGRRLR